MHAALPTIFTMEFNATDSHEMVACFCPTAAHMSRWTSLVIDTRSTFIIERLEGPTVSSTLLAP
ncbi:hypothetical protein YTPLAS18_00440 [Nitrospira sp.]|nr:hypothetical protein YTPLAS18_00440 [Nitrospira sp.]